MSSGYTEAYHQCKNREERVAVKITFKYNFLMVQIKSLIDKVTISLTQCCKDINHQTGINENDYVNIHIKLREK